MKEDKQVEAVMNLMVNAMAVAAGKDADVMGSVGDAIGQMGEALGQAFGDKGAEAGGTIRDQISQGVSTMAREMVTDVLKKAREEMDRQIARLSPAKQKMLLKDVRQESFAKVLETVKKTDYGLPPLTGTLTVEDILRYVQLQDPRLGELIQQLQGLPQPSAFQDEGECVKPGKPAGAKKTTTKKAAKKAAKKKA
jgi:hypothetical protein